MTANIYVLQQPLCARSVRTNVGHSLLVELVEDVDQPPIEGNRRDGPCFSLQEMVFLKLFKRKLKVISIQA